MFFLSCRRREAEHFFFVSKRALAMEWNRVWTNLVDGAGVGHGFVVLDDGDRLSRQDRLVDADRGRHDLHDADVGRDLVTH